MKYLDILENDSQEAGNAVSVLTRCNVCTGDGLGGS